jgi:hypothetical protein
LLWNLVGLGQNKLVKITFKLNIIVLLLTTILQSKGWIKVLKNTKIYYRAIPNRIRRSATSYPGHPTAEAKSPGYEVGRSALNTKFSVFWAVLADHEFANLKYLCCHPSTECPPFCFTVRHPAGTYIPQIRKFGLSRVYICFLYCVNIYLTISFNGGTGFKLR